MIQSHKGLPSDKNWKLYAPAPQAFLDALPEHPLLLQVLYNRGLRAADEVKAFLATGDPVTENPYRLRDMAPAVTRIVRAIEREEIICVYGDFDADGVCATALLVTALQAAGGRVGPYIPNRVDEGYGLNVEAITQIAAKAQLMVTVDCGIRSVQEAAHAMRLGLDVIVTDHHSVGPELPPALAVINPRRKDCPSKFDRLAGVGVAYRLAQAVLRAVAQQRWSDLNRDQAAGLEERLLDLVALGTVADMMPLLGENRSLVQRGLAQLNRARRPGLETLMAHADLRPGAVDTMAISFRLAPRINAAGRLAHASLAYQLLRTQDPTQAYSLTTELEALNQQRRRLTLDAQQEAEQQLMPQLAHNLALLVVRSPRIPSGIVGLVAGKLVDRYYRPAVVIEEGEEEARGSARSIAEFNITQALDELRHLLVRHGGHALAAGFTIKSAHLAEFTQALAGIAQQRLSGYSDLRPTLHIDADVPFDALNWGLQQQFARLEPTGQENPLPLLLCRNLRIREARQVGGGKHLRLIVDKGPAGAVMDAVAFSQGEWGNHLSQGSRIDAVFHLEANEWDGRQRLQLNIQDLRPAE
jgi:single-stranded-DNA-specific exonuclease